MATVFANSVSQHHAALLRVAGVDAVYLRGNVPLEIRVVPGQVDREEFGLNLIETSADARDWLVIAEDLVLDGKRILPQRGDMIRVNGVEHELMPRSEVGVWRYSDQFEILIRLYTLEAEGIHELG